MKCPRREEMGDTSMFKGLPTEDSYGTDNESCSWCGSMNPDIFMLRCEAGNMELTPTDKSYKVYVKPHGDNAPRIKPIKFYFQHLSVEQRKRFVELHNEKRLVLAMPGHFYVLPFFMVRA